MWMQSPVQVADTEILFQHQALCKLIQDHVKCKAHHLLLIKTVPNLSQGSSSRNEDTMPAIIQCEISNELSEERKSGSPEGNVSRFE